MAKTMRLDKLLGHTGWGTRRELKELCKGGHVTVNGAVCRDSSQKIDPAADAVASTVRPSIMKRLFISCSTSAGVVSATEDNVSPTVIGLLPRQYQGAGLFPVGRLDKDTTASCSSPMTDLAHGITSPKKHTDKIYDAVVEGDIPEM